ncbi:type I phosphomannose isomerase catalytic subunit [Crateriforma conspicua]|uniref:type I phosphomannose isomerase catalytic subunit n=1 Tax=Crateriforma conspicua TaxID=2527996 RepID=UPI00118B8191|nr:type I phosphomannose isomerase catalytic subunit [Crateriforma conspicua]QDV64938.1 putative mannose-6-phosphate isomerase GmuF [Crateriforma conspicua]
MRISAEPSVDGYPLSFTPVLKRTLWGGRRLGEMLGKPLGAEQDYAESWEIVDHGDDQSIVDAGPLKGQSLAQILAERPEWLLGPAWEKRVGQTGASGGRFPLLLKYLDCNRVLSVQVHPDDAYARQMDPPDLGKTEAWYVVAAEPESLIYAGLKEGVDRQTLAEAVEAGQTEQVLHSFHPSPGDCVFIPAGTVHALGEGLIIAEIQQSSDTTFRLFDWNRVDAQGNARPLHIEPSLAVSDYQAGPAKPSSVDPSAEGWQSLVQCDKFTLRALSIGRRPIGGDGRCVILTVPHGTVVLQCGDEERELRTGQSLLIPAACAECQVEPTESSLLLAMGLPDETV